MIVIWMREGMGVAAVGQVSVEGKCWLRIISGGHCPPYGVQGNNLAPSVTAAGGDGCFDAND